MEPTFLSLDPGTRKAGLAIWQGPHLVDCQLLTMGDRRVERRFLAFLEQLNGAMNSHRVTTLATEKPFMHRDHPAHELWVLFNRIVAEARWTGWTLYQYAPATVIATNRLRGDKERQGKGVIRRHIELRYGSVLPVSKLDDNVVDALGIGYTHLVKTGQV